MNQLLIILIIINIAFSIILFFYFRWYSRKNAAKELLAEQRDEIRQLIAEIDIITDRDTLLVEERIKTLKKLLEDTDKKIANYLKVLERSSSIEQMYTQLSHDFRSGETIAPASAANQSESQLPTAPALSALSAAQLFPDNETAQNTVESQDHKGKKDRNKVLPASKKTDVRAQIAELALQGHDPGRIAAKLKISITEVELVLNLIKKQPSD